MAAEVAEAGACPGFYPTALGMNCPNAGLAFRESLGRFEQDALEEEAREAAEQAEAEGRRSSGSAMPRLQPIFTDPESRIMPGPGGGDFQQSYNCQLRWWTAHQVA